VSFEAGVEEHTFQFMETYQVAAYMAWTSGVTENVQNSLAIFRTGNGWSLDRTASSPSAAQVKSSQDKKIKNKKYIQ
jgi:hypothetical protein